MLAWRTNLSSTSSRGRKRPGRSPCPPTITRSRPGYVKLANPSRYSVNEYVFRSLVGVFWFLCTEGCRPSRPTNLCPIPNQRCSRRGHGGGRGILFGRGGSRGRGSSVSFVHNRTWKTHRTPGILHGGNCGSSRSQEVNSRVLPAQVGFPLYCPIGVIRH